MREAPLRLLAAICVVAGLLPLANVLTGGTAVPWWNLAVREWIVRGAIVLAAALLLAQLLGARVDDLAAVAERRLLSVSRALFGASAAILALLAAAFLSFYCFNAEPFTSDEMAQQWHAQILLSGRFAAVPEQAREFFNTAPVFDRGGRWFSQYPVGGPAVMAIGVALKAPWLVNPLLFAVATWYLYGFLAVAGDELIARVSTLLFLISPMVLIMAASQMNHVPALAFTMIALAALARWDLAKSHPEQRREAAIIGVSLGVVALLRPLDAAILGLTAAAFQIRRATYQRDRWTSLATQVVAGLLPVVVLLWANARTTGHPFVFGYEALNGPEHRLGFHLDPAGELHTPLRGLRLASGYLLRLNRYLFEWPIPSLLLVVAGLWAVREPSRWDVLLAALAIGFIVAYGAYWFNGFFSGPRFLFTAVPVFIYFAARALGALSAARPPTLRRAALLIVPLCVLASWIGPDGVSSARTRVASYRAQRTKLKTDVDAEVARAGIHNALIFVNEGWRGRLVARLRVVGATQFQAERMVSALDACGLQMALDNEDHFGSSKAADRLHRIEARASAVGVARLEPTMPADQVIALVPGSQPTSVCIREFQHDTGGTMPYAMFLSRQRVDATGHVDGDIIFARDLGERNEVLRSRFGDRTWFTYRPARGDTASEFIPIQRRSPRTS